MTDQSNEPGGTWGQPGAAPTPPPPPGYGPPPPGYGPPPGSGAPPGWGPPQGYGQPPPYYGAHPAAHRTNGLAIASMVLGILWIWWIGSVLALIFGYVARGQIRQRGEGGDGMAIAGIVLGWIGVATLTFFIVAGIMATSSGPGY